MKIRQQITIWIAGTALLAAVGFSVFIFYALLAEPYKFIDSELQHLADALTRQVTEGRNQTPAASLDALLPYSPDQYWIKMTDDKGVVLYQSRLAQHVDIPTAGKPGPQNVELVVPRTLAQIGQDADDEVLFRVRVLHRQFPDRMVTVAVAKPIEVFEEEIQLLLWQMAVALITFTVLVVVASYLLAGRILRPIVEINTLTRKTSETSLDQRIPLGKNQDELQALSDSLNRMFDRLQYSFNRQKEFVGNAAHELKSPITLLMLAQDELIKGTRSMNPCALILSARPISCAAWDGW